MFGLLVLSSHLGVLVFALLVPWHISNWRGDVFLGVAVFFEVIIFHLCVWINLVKDILHKRPFLVKLIISLSHLEPFLVSVNRVRGLVFCVDLVLNHLIRISDLVVEEPLISLHAIELIFESVEPSHLSLLGS